MSEQIKVREIVVGNLAIPNGKVDITDPCYDREVWCRINQKKIKPGNYECYALKYEKENRIAACGIRIKDYPEYFEDDLEPIGEIGVDAGMAGFFPEKPDYDGDAWNRLCENEFNGEYPTICLYKDGFCTTSGYGDGCYTVYALKDQQGEIIALEIHFL